MRGIENSGVVPKKVSNKAMKSKVDVKLNQSGYPLISVTVTPQAGINEDADMINFSNAELLKFAQVDSAYLNSLVKVGYVAFSKLASIRDSQGVSLLVHLASLDFQVLENWVCEGIVSVRQLAEIIVGYKKGLIGVSKSDLLEYMLFRDATVIDRLLEKEVVDIFELARIQLRRLNKPSVKSQYTPFHSYAIYNPTGLTQLISTQRDPKLFAHFVGRLKLDGLPVISLLISSSEKEILKWVVDYHWFTVEDCVQIGYSDTTEAPFDFLKRYKHLYGKSFEQAVVDYKKAQKKQGINS